MNGSGCAAGERRIIGDGSAHSSRVHFAPGDLREMIEYLSLLLSVRNVCQLGNGGLRDAEIAHLKGVIYPVESDNVERSDFRI